jgi:general secretion pathway protein G
MCLRKIIRSRGLTLVEILVVVLIIVVLASISIPTYFTLRRRAREVATKAEMRTIATCLELYNVLQEQYPLTENGLATLRAAGIVTPIPDFDEWGMPYTYISDGSVYELRSGGVDTTLYTEDDIVFENGKITGLGRYNTPGS